VGNAVPEAEQGMQIARYIALLSLPSSVPAFTINRYCGSGLEAIAIASAKIHAGLADCIIAGGTESMSMVPVMGWKTALNYEIAKAHPDYYIGMGLTAEQVAQQFNISRMHRTSSPLSRTRKRWRPRQPVSSRTRLFLSRSTRRISMPRAARRNRVSGW
jgi:acetyl-CoA acetyltransferase